MITLEKQIYMLGLALMPIFWLAGYYDGFTVPGILAFGTLGLLLALPVAVLWNRFQQKDIPNSAIVYSAYPIQGHFCAFSIKARKHLRKKRVKK